MLGRMIENVVVGLFFIIIVVAMKIVGTMDDIHDPSKEV